MYVDLAAMRLHKPARDRQTQSGSSLLAGNAVVDLLKFIENPSLMFRRNSGSSVLDFYLEMIAHRIRANLDKAGIGELDGITHNVEQDLSEAPFIAIPYREIGRDGRSDLYALGMGE